MMMSVRKFSEWLLLCSDLCTWWWRQYGSFMNDIASSEWGQCTWWWRQYGSFMNDIAPEPTFEHDDDISMGLLLMTSSPLSRHVNMMVISVRKFSEWLRLLCTDLCTWWWRKYGSFMNEIASSEPTCVHNDDVSTGVLWITSPPLSRPV